MTYDELTEQLPARIADAFILAPGYIGADSLDLEHYIETVWKAPVTEKNYKAVAESFRQWYKKHHPDEYHDPPTVFPGIGHGWGGARAGGGHKRGVPNPGAGRKPISPAGRRAAVHVTFDPDLRRLVQWHAAARGNTFSESVNVLLAEALTTHEVEAAEVL